ncbi:hypothetical protein Srubr_56100 [Streptomyces rubradiris]|uniref:GyrI-like small molecule binding domain-containing protein n=1 Tax=Streptomyces rubradiris TaxID=285531 RepID=A0ABQ3RIV5_STRRR|nr:hypothetical protein GCM10018792_27950 [Streptomyces rubradiris]GHI55764.1 hypothetical protein Srubr_56100 [Streptomyces rubradiris]
MAGCDRNATHGAEESTGRTRPVPATAGASPVGGGGPGRCLVVSRPVDAVLPTAQALARWIDAGGYRSAGYPREVSLECPENLDDWVTELQAPVTRG